MRRRRCKVAARPCTWSSRRASCGRPLTRTCERPASGSRHAAGDGPEWVGAHRSLSRPGRMQQLYLEDRSAVQPSMQRNACGVAPLRRGTSEYFKTRRRWIAGQRRERSAAGSGRAAATQTRAPNKSLAAPLSGSPQEASQPLAGILATLPERGHQVKGMARAGRLAAQAGRASGRLLDDLVAAGQSRAGSCCSTTRGVVPLRAPSP